MQRNMSIRDSIYSVILSSVPYDIVGITTGFNLFLPELCFLSFGSILLERYIGKIPLSMSFVTIFDDNTLRTIGRAVFPPDSKGDHSSVCLFEECWCALCRS